MNIGSLSDFIVLAESRSFSTAAQLRNVTQPAFSRRIRALEHSLDVDLVDRRANAFALTPAGQRFLVHARQIVASTQDAIEDVRCGMDGAAAPVRMAMPSFVSKTVFPAWYRHMQARIPGLTVRIQRQAGSGAIDQLRKNLTDFAMIFRAWGTGTYYDLVGLETLPVGSDRMQAVCGRHARNRLDFLMYLGDSYLDTCARVVFGNRLAEGRTVFETSSTGLLKEMAISGFGTTALPESLIEDDLAQGYLIPAFDDAALECDILLVRRPGGGMPAVEALWQATVSA